MAVWYLLQRIWVDFAEVLVELDEVEQVLVEHGRRGERHQDLILPKKNNIGY